MKTTLIFAMTFTVFNSFNNNLVINFGSSPDQIKDWVVLSDNVMGGLSKSKLEYTENTLLLTGNISLENYGGFSSVKTKFGKFDLSEYKGVKIKYKSTNQKFAFTLEDSQNWTLPNYKGDLTQTKENEWEETTLYFKDFKEYRIGGPTGKKLSQINLKNMIRLGIITTEKKTGPFSIEVDYIEFIR